MAVINESTGRINHLASAQSLMEKLRQRAADQPNATVDMFNAVGVHALVSIAESLAELVVLQREVVHFYQEANK